MRQVIECLMEVAIANVPEKESEYKEAYTAIDGSISAIRNPRAGKLTLDKLSEAMTTADFPNALGEFVDRALWPAYERKVFNYQPLVFNDTVPNFLTVTRYQRQAGLDDLELVRPKAAPKAGYIPDAAKREYRVYRWEKGFDFEMEAIVNDDLGYFTDFATLMGDAARRSVEKFVSRLYFNTTTIAGLQALGALYSTTARLSTNALMVAWHAFTQRLDARGEPIETSPVNLVIHRGLELTARQILQSQQVAENATNALNVLPPLNIIVDPYMTGTAPKLPWYLFSNPNQSGIRPVTLVRLQGRPGPLVLQKAPDQMVFSGFGRTGALVPGLGDFDSGNIPLKVADIWGGWADSTYAGLTDYRGAYYSSGTTG